MDWTTVLLLSIGFITGIVFCWVWLTIRRRMKIPWAGNIIVDMRRDCEDAIRIESPRGISKWSKYKQLLFSVVVEYDKPTPIKDISRRK